jgi:hypothetical protein
MPNCNISRNTSSCCMSVSYITKKFTPTNIFLSTCSLSTSASKPRQQFPCKIVYVLRIQFLFCRRPVHKFISFNLVHLVFYHAHQPWSPFVLPTCSPLLHLHWFSLYGTSIKYASFSPPLLSEKINWTIWSQRVETDQWTIRANKYLAPLQDLPCPFVWRLHQARR